MQYRTVFDIADGYTQWGLTLWGLLFTAFLALPKVVSDAQAAAPWWNGDARTSRIGGVLGLAFAIVFTLIAFGSSYGSYHALRVAADGPDVRVEEGVTTGFQPPPYPGGKGRERFCVGGVCFQYAEYVMDAAFHHTSAHGGPMRAGLQVRVTHVGNAILKLELAD